MHEVVVVMSNQTRQTGSLVFQDVKDGWEDGDEDGE